MAALCCQHGLQVPKRMQDWLRPICKLISREARHIHVGNQHFDMLISAEFGERFATFERDLDLTPQVLKP
jgi:hypothetical protein